MKVQDTQLSIQKNHYYCVRVLTIIPSIVYFLLLLLKSVKPKLIFASERNDQVLIADHYRSSRECQPCEIRENLQLLTRRIVRSNLAQNSNALRSQEDYITQVSEEIEDRTTKKLSQEFSRTETRILGTLSRLDDFLLNPLIQGHSRTGDVQERIWYKPGNERGRLPE